jgi:cellobiose phosphorylase
MKSAITPTLHGDIKIEQNHFGMIPVSQEDLKNPLNARNIFFRVNGECWNVTGLTPYQKYHLDDVTLENGLLYQKVLRKNDLFQVEITSFVPTNDSFTELHKVIFKNLSKSSLKVKTVVGIPIYGRSADNLRDHRHVTSLLNRIHIVKDGIINVPSLSFDERGHQKNTYAYGVFAKSSLHTKVEHYWPILHEFIGEGQDLFYPEVVSSNKSNTYQVGDVLEGYEAMGGFEYNEVKIPNNSVLELIVSFEIHSDIQPLLKSQVDLSTNLFDSLLEENKAFWKKDLITSDFTIGSVDFSGWLRQVGIQPLARRIYGNSFLPHHDYGKGGRGWRDLWQDSLELVLKNPKEVKDNIISYFKGVRIDGTNATIIGSKKGEFKADRNQIVRVWSDHGAWPFLTLDFYINRTGDIDILLEKQGYFKDKFTHYTKRVDTNYKEKINNDLLTVENQVYLGSIIEHVLIETLTAFYNVGEHGNIRIEDADWNDGFDMAGSQGESVSFTHMYVGNIKKIISVLEEFLKNGVDTWSFLEEFQYLLDINEDVSKLSPVQKQDKLNFYFDHVSHKISGKKISLSTKALINDLRNKYLSMESHLNSQEWITSKNNEFGCYNGYYDNEGVRVESLDEPSRMTLTGQVFPMMAHIASHKQIEQIIHTVNHYLYSDKVKSYHLNSRFGKNKMNIGRFMGFAYGHKENGAFFSHMTIMYAYSLIENGYVKAGEKVIDDLVDYLLDINKSKILPGIPEYIDPEGRGMYHFLTGSASWVIITVVEQMFGIKSIYGDFIIQPQLASHHFRNGIAKINVLFHGHIISITYINPKQIDYGKYKITKAFFNQKNLDFEDDYCKITPTLIGQNGEIHITLGEK